MAHNHEWPDQCDLCYRRYRGMNVDQCNIPYKNITEDQKFGGIDMTCRHLAGDPHNIKEMAEWVKYKEHNHPNGVEEYGHPSCNINEDCPWVKYGPITKVKIFLKNLMKVFKK